MRVAVHRQYALRRHAQVRMASTRKHRLPAAESAQRRGAALVPAGAGTLRPAALRRLWSGLPEPAVCSPSGCAQLVLLLLGLGLLCFEPDGGRCKAVVCARGDGAMPDALRRAPLCTHGAPLPAAADASSVDQQQALLEQLEQRLVELHRKERRAAALNAELGAELRG